MADSTPGWWIRFSDITEGYSLVAKYKKSVSPKGIFVYPLSRNFREELRGEPKSVDKKFSFKSIYPKS